MMGWRRGFAPEPQLKVSEWADTCRMLPATSAEPGKWRTSRTEYLREVMDCLSVSSPVERVILMKAAQIGASEAALNFCGYVIANAPGVLLYVMPTDQASRRNVRLRVDPLIDSTPELARLVTRRRSRQAGNNDSLKTFPGGQLSFVGALTGAWRPQRSAAFRSRSTCSAIQRSAMAGSILPSAATGKPSSINWPTRPRESFTRFA
jgi:phage terminase large subunit GpA-like protein